jgi:hypothetical protein
MFHGAASWIPTSDPEQLSTQICRGPETARAPTHDDSPHSATAIGPAEETSNPWNELLCTSLELL